MPAEQKLDKPLSNETMQLTVRVRAACQAGFSEGSKTPIDGFDIDKEIEISAVDVSNLEKPVKALRPTAGSGRFKAPGTDQVFDLKFFISSAFIDSYHKEGKKYVGRETECHQMPKEMSNEGHKSHYKH